MNRTPVVAVLASFFLAALGSAEAVPPAWSHYARVQPNQPGLARVVLPEALLDRAAPDLRDLRLFDGAGVETPYLLTQNVRTPARWAPLMEFGAILEKQTTLLSAKGPTGPVDALRLNSPATEFLKSVSLEVREGAAWKTLWSGRPIFRTRFGAEHMEIAFPARRLNEFRIRVLDEESDPIPFTGVSARGAEDVVPPVQDRPLVLARTETSATESALALLLPARHLYLDGLRVRTSEPVFQRRVRVVRRRLAGADTPGMGPRIIDEVLGAATLFRASLERGAVQESLVIPINRRVDAREIVLVVTNGDAPPLEISSVSAQIIPTELRFMAKNRDPLALSVGNGGASVPRYEWPVVRAVPHTASVSDLFENPDYRAPEPAPLLATVGAPFKEGGWTYRAGVTFQTPGVHHLELPLSVLVKTAGEGRDLRLVRAGRQIPFIYDRSTLYREAAVEFQPLDTSSPRLSRWEILLPEKGVPVTHLELWAREPLFQRAVHLYEEHAAVDGSPVPATLARALWRRSGGSGRWVLPCGRGPEGKRIILEIENGDNAPLQIEKASVHFRSFALVFKADPGEPMWLYYGNPDAASPVYDAVLVADELLSTDKSPAVLLTPEKLHGGWTWGGSLSRGPRLLFWIVLALITAVLLWGIQRLVPGEPNGSPRS